MSNLLSSNWISQKNKRLNNRLTKYKALNNIHDLYYSPNGNAIIVTFNNYEYYFDSTKDAKDKLGISDSKLSKIKRLVKYESKDDFQLDLDTGLYRREIQNES